MAADPEDRPLGGRLPPGFVRRTVSFFIPLAVLATAMCGLAYVETQQALRSGANDPQFQIAEDAAALLNGGATPASVVDTRRAVDLAASLAPFLIVLDPSGGVLATNATLDGGQPVPPQGVLDSAASGSPDVVTWQPRAGVRIASVTIRWNGGTVVAGRSLRRIEDQESTAELIAGAAWLASLAALAGASLIAAWFWPRQEKASD